MLAAALVAIALLCAVQAIRAQRLLASALWLAGVSAVLSLTLYVMGAHEVAVIELSVGTGLVTVLFVFAISIAGEELLDLRTLVPKPLAFVLAASALALLALRILPAPEPAPVAGATLLRDVLWGERALDVLVQIVLVFAGVVGVLGLLSEAPEAPPATQPAVPESDIAETWALESGAGPHAQPELPEPEPEVQPW